MYKEYEEYSPNKKSCMYYVLRYHEGKIQLDNVHTIMYIAYVMIALHDLYHGCITWLEQAYEHYMKLCLKMWRR